MKTICLFMAVHLSLLVSVSSFSQEKRDAPVSVLTDSFKLKKESRFLFNVHGGYNVGLGSTFKFYPDDITNISVEIIDNNSSVKNVTSKSSSKGLGDGFRYGAGLSYILNDFINIGLDVDYFKSTIRKVKDSSYREVNSAASSDYTYKDRTTISYDADLLTITPSITFKAISRPKFFIYNKIGAIVTIRPNSLQRERQDISSRNGWMGFFKDSTAYSEKKYDWGLKNPAFGFMGSVGAQVKVTEVIRAFAEIQFSHVIFKVRSRTLTDFEVDGKEKINTLTESERKTQFEKELTNNEWNMDPNKPSRQIAQRFPVTYIGLQIGVAYHF